MTSKQDAQFAQQTSNAVEGPTLTEEQIAILWAAAVKRYQLNSTERPWIAIARESYSAGLQAGMAKERERSEHMLRIAAGMLSTFGLYASKHPQYALDAIRAAAAESDIAAGSGT